MVVFFNFLINLNENDVFKALKILLFSHNLGGEWGFLFSMKMNFFYENTNWWLGNRISFSEVEIFYYPLLISKL